MIYLIGASGGLVAVLGMLLSSSRPVFSTYAQYDVVGLYAWSGFGLRVVLFMLIGAFWVYLNHERERLKAFQLGIAAPFAIAALLAQVPKADATPLPEANAAGQQQASDLTRPFGAFWSGLMGLPLTLPVAVAAEVSSQSETTTTDLASRIRADAIAKFAGNERREFSDELIQLFESQPQVRPEIVTGLVDALQSDGRYEYRTNLYILRTLGKLDGWTAQPEQLRAVQALAADPLAEDPTFRSWLTQATAKAGVWDRPM